jgi:leader peptidase (prepilin peptidase)/N-methyltransferase
MVVEPTDSASLPGALVPGPEGAPRSSEEDWTPGPHNLPFGPWLSLGALEVLLLGPWLAQRLPILVSEWFLGA